MKLVILLLPCSVEETEAQRLSRLHKVAESVMGELGFTCRQGDPRASAVGHLPIKYINQCLQKLCSFFPLQVS